MSSRDDLIRQASADPAATARITAAEAAQQRREAVRALLAEDGATLASVAALLKVSRQRVHQLAARREDET